MSGRSRPNGLSYHEGKCCDASIRLLEAKQGFARRDLRSPEKEGAEAPIELTTVIGDQLFAIEHTGIEPFAGHMRLQAEGPLDFEPLREQLATRLPAEDFYELHVPANAMQGLPKGSRARVRQALLEWIETTAPTLPRTEIYRYARPIRRETPPGVPFEVSLHRHARPAIFPVGFSVKHIVTAADQEAERRDRIRAACAKKFPKLAWWKQNAGARTVLVFEDNDIQLSNASVIYQALAAVEGEFADRPDEIHVVTSIVEPDWWLDRLRVDDVGYFQLQEHTAEFDPNVLRDLTRELDGAPG